MNPTDTGEQQLLFFLDWFRGTTALLVLSVFLLAVVVTIICKPTRWVWLTLLFYVSTLGADATTPWFRNLLAFPLQDIRTYCRPLATGLLVLLVIPTAMSRRGWRSRLLMAAIPLFFGFQVLMTARFAA